MLEPRIVMTILEYDMTNFRKFLRLSPNWHHLVLEGINERMNKVEVDFVNKYYEHLFFKKSYTNSSIMYFGGRGGMSARTAGAVSHPSFQTRNTSVPPPPVHSTESTTSAGSCIAMCGTAVASMSRMPGHGPHTLEIEASASSAG